MNEEAKRLYLEGEEIEEVRVIWDPRGYKLIEVRTKDGETFLVESD